MLKTFNLVSISLSILLLSGCATPKLLTATEDSVSYEYDNNFMSSKFVAQTPRGGRTPELPEQHTAYSDRGDQRPTQGSFGQVG